MELTPHTTAGPAASARCDPHSRLKKSTDLTPAVTDLAPEVGAAGKRFPQPPGGFSSVMLGEFDSFNKNNMGRADHIRLPKKYDKEPPIRANAAFDPAQQEKPWDNPEWKGRRRPPPGGFEEPTDNPQPQIGVILPPAEHWNNKKPPPEKRGRVTRLHAQVTHTGAAYFIN